MLTSEQREAMETAIAYLDAGGNPRTAESLRSILASAAPAEGRDSIWLHEIVEPDGRASTMLSRSPENPWSHWLQSHLATCRYKVTRYDLATAPTMSEAVLMEAYRALQNTLLEVPDGEFRRKMNDWLTAKLDEVDRAAAKGESDE